MPTKIQLEPLHVCAEGWDTALRLPQDVLLLSMDQVESQGACAYQQIYNLIMCMCALWGGNAALRLPQNALLLSMDRVESQGEGQKLQA